MPVIFILFFLSVSVAFADVEIKDGKMSASFSSQPLRQVVEQISRQTDIQFSIDEAVANQSLNASFKDLPIAMGIKKMLEGTGINYAVIGQGEQPIAVFIGKSEAPGSTPRPLDTRPPNRGVVTPINPIPQPQPTVTSPPLPGYSRPQKENPALNPDRKPEGHEPVKPVTGGVPASKNTSGLPPTAGDFNVNPNPTQPPLPPKSPQDLMQDDEEDEEDDED